MNNLYKIKIHNSDGSSRYYNHSGYRNISQAKAMCTRMSRWGIPIERTFIIEEFQLNLVATHEVR